MNIDKNSSPVPEADCENCEFFVYDEEKDESMCLACLDEDELSRLESSGGRVCRYYRPYDEYKTVRKQN